MKPEEFEPLLDETVRRLGEDVRSGRDCHEARAFERRAADILQSVARTRRVKINPVYHPHAFPDILANGFGVEVKSTRQDSWESVGNSILESTRPPNVDQIYVVLGKMGGMPGVRWRRYEDAIKHVRISHAPRFVIDLGDQERESLFQRIGVSYAEFAAQDPAEKMRHVREYARGRLEPGERLWWLEDEHSVDLQVKRFGKFSPEEKKKLRAETAVLCPEIAAPPGRFGDNNKYDAALHFLVTYRGVLASRDIFTAGSAGMTGGKKGGNYLPRGLRNIEPQMKAAFEYLERALFAEYWPEGTEIPSDKEDRLRVWLMLADKFARGHWTPSEVLFKK